MAAGKRDALVLCVGDSTTAGAYSAGATQYLAARAGSWPSVLAGLIGANDDAWNGNNSITGVTQLQYDPRWVAATSWSGSVNTLGGLHLLNSSNANPLSRTPTYPWDFVDIWTPQNSGLGSMTADVDGGATTTINENATALLVKTVVTASGGVGTHTLNLKRVSGQAYVGGLVFHNSAQKRINICNAGQSGAAIASFVANSTPWDALPVLKALAPDLTIICLTINDADGGPTAIATFMANTQILINAAKLSGDVILMTGAQSDPGTYPLATQQIYASAYRVLAARNRLILIDTFSAWGGYAQANANGWMADPQHPDGTGYGLKAKAVAAVL